MTSSAEKTLLLTGFGPFGSITENPSARLIESLKLQLLQHKAVPQTLTLPVSYTRAPALIDNMLNHQRFDLVLGFGVHRGQDFRFETTARPIPVSTAKDNDGDTGVVFNPMNRQQLYTSLNADRIVQGSNREEQWMRQSGDASGYVCEAVYHRLLSHSLQNGSECAFIHIPKFEYCPLEKQCDIILNVIRLISP